MKKLKLAMMHWPIKNEGKLTPSEEEELDSLVRANTLFGLLKAEAQLVLLPAAL